MTIAAARRPAIIFAGSPPARAGVGIIRAESGHFFALHPGTRFPPGRAPGDRPMAVGDTRCTGHVASRVRELKSTRGWKECLREEKTRLGD